MGSFHPNLFCQIHPQMCGSDIADTIAKEMGSIGGLAGSGWAKTSGEPNLTRPRSAPVTGARTNNGAN
eukprot:925245-Pelagomonas_calceolata.AAC.15